MTPPTLTRIVASVLVLAVLVPTRTPAQEATNLRPGELVADRISRALEAPDSPDSWSDLAEALPALAEDGPSFAAWVADSIASETARLSGPPGLIYKAEAAWVAVVSRARVAAVAIESRVRSAGVDPMVAAGIAGGTGVLLLLLGGIVRRRARRKAAHATWTMNPIDGARPERAVVVIRDLSNQGIPLLEISRRTGMAQDVLRFLLSQSGSPDPSEGASRTGARAGMGLPGRETESGPGSAIPGSDLNLRDGMLTYGAPGR